MDGNETQRLTAETIRLARSQGLELNGEVSFNEMGLDFRVAFAEDMQGKRWVLRIPRRGDLFPRIEHEAKISAFVRSRLHVQVPEWQICTPELIAYPMLLDPVALTFDAKTCAVTWNMDQHSSAYVESFAKVLVALHGANISEARAAGIGYAAPEQVRTKFLADLDRVKSEVGIGKDLDEQLRRWVNDDKRWPEFSTLVHGDLYAGHVTVDSSSRISGIIDWSEAEISDPSIDFAGHIAVFGEESLEKLLAAYAANGGRTWPTMAAHIKARSAASPIRYALFAIVTQSDAHMAAAKAQLGVPSE